MPVRSNDAKNILDYDVIQLRTIIKSLGHPEFRANQLLHWIYQKRVYEFSSMTTLSKSFRLWLLDNFKIEMPKVISEKRSADDTIKWLLQLDPLNSIEMVYIPETNRGTLCVSSQVGCALNCSFCLTGIQGFNRNLSTSEIISQFIIAREKLSSDYPSLHPITNVVFMGMGEPLTNELAVFPAAGLMTSEHALHLSPRKVTISTSGIVPAIVRMKSSTNVRLAVSLHACRDDLRDQLVPINKKFNLKSLIQTCIDHYSEKRNYVTFEYIMINNINDTHQDCLDLIKTVKRVPFSKVNLIPFNSFAESNYQPTPLKKIVAFQAKLIQSNIVATIRKTRGDDKLSACGQLAGVVKNRLKKIQCNNE
ncbi:MAG TPA: 23S rRNA (adenine(2503)-C(2))-methyltransferase RlmN [Gammaproteobacteria bacterium]|nr:23S rRNA (adenine(2503)-C(2))-methyltransferase RlmN [Gammaproteobacteria bacterium]